MSNSKKTADFLQGGKQNSLARKERRKNKRQKLKLLRSKK